MKESKSNPSAVIVGGGFGGIATALRLRAKGWRVTLTLILVCHSSYRDGLDPTVCWVQAAPYGPNIPPPAFDALLAFPPPSYRCFQHPHGLGLCVA